MFFFKFSVKLLLWLIAMMCPLRRNYAYNYCNNRSHLCEVSHMKHFICHMDTELRPLHSKAQFVAAIPDTVPLRNLILDYHNNYRNMLASGALRTNSNETFPEASRMRELIWDLELAYMARVHAATVSFKHTMCRSVNRFPIVGENLGLVFSSTERRSLRELLDLSLLPMFNEYKLATDVDNLIDNFQAMAHHNIGHFTLMVSDRVSRVGCAYAVARNCDNGDGLCHFMTCHYDFNNIARSFIYKPGEPASRCSIWGSTVSHKYSYLCANNGNIFDMDHGETLNSSLRLYQYM